MEDVREYLSRKGLEIQKEVHESGGLQFILETCPLCGKVSEKGHRRFYIQADTGQWMTYCCNQKGNLFTLKEQLGDLDIFKGPENIAAEANKRAQNSLVEKIRSMQEKKRRKHGIDVDIYAMQDALKEHQNALDYLHDERKFSDEIIEKFRLGYSIRRGWKCKKCGQYTTARGIDPQRPDGSCAKELKDDKGHKSICGGELNMNSTFSIEYFAIPIYEDGILMNVKYRTVPPAEKGFERETGAETTVFNVDSLDKASKSVYICESETDAIALVSYGIEPVVALTSGASSGAGLIEKNKDKFLSFDEVFLVLDMDEPGEKAVSEIAAVLGPYRCRRVQLDFKDANQCLKEGVPVEDIRRAIRSSEPLAENTIKHISEFRDMLVSKFDPQRVKGISTGYDTVDEFIYGLAPGDLTIVTGAKGSGKTSFVTSLVLKLVEQGYPVMASSPEMSRVQMIHKLVSMHGKQLVMNMSAEERMEAFDSMSKLPLYLHDHHGKIPFSILADPIEFGVRKHGFRVMILDHLAFYVQKALTEGQERLFIDNAMYEILETTQKLGIHTILVAHPKKSRIDHAGKRIEADLGDLKGSSEIDNLASNVIRVWKPRNDTRTQSGLPKAVLTFLKVRDIHGKEGSVKLRFHPETLEYTRWGDEDQQEDDRIKEESKKSKSKKSEPITAQSVEKKPPKQTALFGMEEKDDDD